MQVVWEADTAAFANRKRAARACSQCQKRKKRCHHTFTRSPDQQAESDGLDKVLPNLTHKEPIRFVGDLNPESVFTDLSTSSQGPNRISRIGVWVKQPREHQDEFQLEENSPAGSTEKPPVNIEKYGKVDGGRRTLTNHQRSYLQSVGAFRVLPKETQDALLSTYIACIDSLLPILHGGKLIQQYTSGNLSIFLIQAICLVTCKTEEAVPYLRLYEDGPILDAISFARSLHIGLDAAMKADLEPDRITRIQILTLMHLHNDGPGGIEESSTHLSQAIHDAWTSGLHIHNPGRITSDEASMLWWTLWILDRVNACIGGRPVMIADRDIDISRPPLNSQDPKLQSLGVWLRLGDLLDKVIEFYRPVGDPDATGWETHFPSFVSVIEGIDLDCTQNSHKTFLELCYNVIQMLACRSGDPSKASYTRRITAANRIQQLIGDGQNSHVPPLPLLPYAASLSLTVAYRGLRDNKTDPERNKQDLMKRCEILESLSSRWWTANAMAKLGRKALNNLQHPGVRKGNIQEIANSMDAEVDPCKFGPFEKKRKRMNDDTAKSRLNTTTTTTAPAPATSTTNETGDNALHLLSDAAVAQASTTSITSISPNSSSNIQPPPPPYTLSSPPIDNTENSLIQPQDVTLNMNMNIEMDMPMKLDPFDQFNNLDNLFDGFFDLSMPTIFEDPLFNGAAYDLGFDTQFSDLNSGSLPQQNQGEMVDSGSGSTYPEIL